MHVRFRPNFSKQPLEMLPSSDPSRFLRRDLAENHRSAQKTPRRSRNPWASFLFERPQVLARQARSGRRTPAAFGIAPAQSDLATGAQTMATQTLTGLAHFGTNAQAACASEMSEAEAIRLAMEGDHDAFERLYGLHSRRVYSLCLRLAGNPTDAEDLTQEAFLQLFRKIHTFRGESRFSTWLHRLTSNLVLMRFRKKRYPEVSLDATLEFDEEDQRPLLEFGGPDLRLSGVIDRV